MPLITLLQHNPVLYLSITVIFGLIVGSFLNVVIHRLPSLLKSKWKTDCEAFLQELDQTLPTEHHTSEKQAEQFNLVTPRSRCPKCGHPITALENIPIISYVLLKGRCAECKTPISVRYPFVEGLSALLALMVAWHFGVTLAAVAAMLLSWALICLTFIDYDHQYLPDDITLPFLWLGLALNINHHFTDLTSAVIGAIAGYLVLWTVFQVFKKVTGKEGMGYGDFKLLAMLGAWLGWQALPAIILLSSLVGSIVGISLIVLKKQDRDKHIPFGPYLATAGWIALIWGQDLNAAYINWIS